MAKELSKENEVVKGYIKSRVDYDVTVQYDGRDCVIAPRQAIEIPDFSKLGKFDPKEIVKLRA